jgi:glycosyltransferase involved in cell wall biosynthesis
MKQKKTRILWVGESSAMMSGFAKINRHMLTRLYKNPKYEVAELACYIEPENPQLRTLPWKVYTSTPSRNDVEGQKKYRANGLAQFGFNVFEKACLDFMPHVVVSSRDWWMDEWIDRSPLRNQFKWIWMPMIDGQPQKTEWIDTFSRVDLFVPACEFAQKVMKEEAPRVNVFSELARPAVDVDIYKPMDNKKELKESFGLPADSQILLTVMRNQPRKLFPELFDTFYEYLQLCWKNGKDELANKSYLLCHTSHPDAGWNFPHHLSRVGIGHKILFSHVCKSCGSTWAGPYIGDLSHCPNCGKLSGVLPNTQFGVSDDVLAKVFNTADWYIQYSVCEGLCMPTCEAKACGVPIMGVDYSAVSEQVKTHLGGIPLPVGRMYHESVKNTGQSRALPDNHAAARIIYDAMSRPEYQKAMSIKALKAAKDFSFDNAALVFEKAIDEVTKEYDERKTWLSAGLSNVQLVDPESILRAAQTPEAIVDLCITHIVKRPDWLVSEYRDKMVNILRQGFEIQGDKRRSIKPVDVIDKFNKMAESMVLWDQERMKRISNEKCEAESKEEFKPAWFFV